MMLSSQSFWRLAWLEVAKKKKITIAALRRHIAHRPIIRLLQLHHHKSDYSKTLAGAYGTAGVGRRPQLLQQTSWLS
jgi:hypothetical protein